MLTNKKQIYLKLLTNKYIKLIGISIITISIFVNINYNLDNEIIQTLTIIGLVLLSFPLNISLYRVYYYTLLGSILIVYVVYLIISIIYINYSTFSTYNFLIYVLATNIFSIFVITKILNYNKNYSKK